MRASLGLIVFAVFLAVNAFGFLNSEIHYKWWKNPRIVQEMDLTQEQSDSIEKIFDSYRDQIMESQKQLAGKEDDLLGTLRKPECSADEVMRITDDIENIKANLTRIRIEMYLKIKNVLTQDQIAKLYQIKSRYRSRLKLSP
ncbi:MAG: Spy/CpxP family protein refolding chaperone [Thermodesulfobacteriota bacterium]